jgi:hypothetical protein
MARQQLANRLRRALDALDRGDLRVHGHGHTVEQTKARIRARIATLEGDSRGRRRDHDAA